MLGNSATLSFPTISVNNLTRSSSYFKYTIFFLLCWPTLFICLTTIQISPSSNWEETHLCYIACKYQGNYISSSGSSLYCLGFPFFFCKVSYDQSTLPRLIIIIIIIIIIKIIILSYFKVFLFSYWKKHSSRRVKLNIL